MKVTVLVPWLEPKFTPDIVTGVPTGPEVGETLDIWGTDVTVNPTPLLATPPTVTTTAPEVAPVGTGVTMLVAVHVVGDAEVPLNLTVLTPCVEPKFAPVIVTVVPTAPRFGDKLVMLGAGTTVNVTPLLAKPATLTTTGPVVAPFGTVVAMLVAPQLVGRARIPLNVTMLVPWVDPKFVPVIVTDVPTEPEVTDKLVMLGAGVVTVKVTPLLAAPETVTTTFPVVAPFGAGAMIWLILQLVGVVSVPLNLTVLVPWVAPKFVPVIMTEVPIAPDVGDKPVMLGAAETVNVKQLLATPLTVTMTQPVVEPVGTGTTMLVALQLVGVAGVPLNVTVLVP